MQKLIYLTSLVLSLVSSARADIFVDVDGLKASFKPQYGWSMQQLTEDGQGYMEIASGNETVISVRLNGSPTWSGSWHGGEIVESKTLKLNGVAVTPVDGQTYLAGDGYADFDRVTNMLGTYRLDHRAHIEPHEISESMHMTPLVSNATVEVVYGWLATRANRLNNYAAFDIGRNLLASGVNNINNDATPPLTLPYLTRAVAQYDPILGTGILTQWELPHNVVKIEIHDRSNDNKLYCRFLAYESATQTFEFASKQSVTFFEASPTNWISVAAGLGKGDMDGNNVVDNFDIRWFEQALTDFPGYTAVQPNVVAAKVRGDISRDGVFDNFDITEFEQMLAHEASAASLSVAVPEPDGIQLLLVGLMLLLIIGPLPARG